MTSRAATRQNDPYGKNPASMQPWVADIAERIASRLPRDLEALVAVSSPSGDVRGAEEAAAVAEEQVREFAELAEERQFAALADEFPHLAEVVAGHVAKVGFDFDSAFEYGLDLILDALEKRRDRS